MRLFIEIHKSADGYTGKVHQGNPEAAILLDSLLLKSDDTVTIGGSSYRLGELVQKLIAYHPADRENIFHAYGQFKIGEWLYEQIIGKLDANLRRQLENPPVEIRIVTDDEDITRLPWSLLARTGTFLSTIGWSITFSRTAICKPCNLPPSPKILVAIPEPEAFSNDIPNTGAKKHLEELEALLSSANRWHKIGKHLVVTHTWEEFKHQVQTFQPHIVYYYGHGVGDTTRTNLVFADNNNRSREVSVADFANCLETFPEKPPKLAYINCCMGDAGGFLGVGWQLGRFIPAVFTNFSKAQTEAAQAQALEIWEHLLIKGIAPHLAIAEMRKYVVKLNQSFDDVRWMTPVLHCNYDQWGFTVQRRMSRFERDLEWRAKLDRTNQIGASMHRIRNMLINSKPKAMAFLWYGQPGQGVDRFHDRLRVEMKSQFQNLAVCEVKPDWPLEYYDLHNSATDMLTYALGAQSLDEITASIREKSEAVSGQQILVYVSHQPVTNSVALPPDKLRSYLDWLDTEFVPRLGENIFAVLGVSFIADDTSNFRREVLEKERLQYIVFKNKHFRLLDELKGVEDTDVFEFLQSYGIDVPEDRRNRVVEEIMRATQGWYDKTLQLLIDIESKLWAGA